MSIFSFNFFMTLSYMITKLSVRSISFVSNIFSRFLVILLLKSIAGLIALSSFSPASISFSIFSSSSISASNFKVSKSFLIISSNSFFSISFSVIGISFSSKVSSNSSSIFSSFFSSLISVFIFF